jgi:glycosyltransferase involved in cell wall biosynthesis
VPGLPPSVLHIIPRLSLAGAGRALIGIAKYSAQSDSFRHSAISLSPADKGTLDLASQAGLNVLPLSATSEVVAALADADIVHFHYWNSPELHDLWARQLPPMRAVLWSHVNGHHSPHLITREVIQWADIFVAATPMTLELDLVKSLKRGQASLILCGADFARVEDIRAQHDTNFNVGYIGSVDFAKIHPSFVAMCADIDVPSAHFIICGPGKAIGALKKQVRTFKDKGRFEFLDYVEDVRSVIARLDVFGYPLCENNYSAGELVLQEVMHAGVPPVVLPYGGAPHLIAHGETGLVAKDEKEYARAVEFLYRYPDERNRLGRNAAARARELFGARNCAEKFSRVYEHLLQLPKAIRGGSSVDLGIMTDAAAQSNRGTTLLLRSLGDAAADFRASIFEDRDLLETEARIAAMEPAIGDCILDYWNYFPADGHLALWAGLVLLNRERPALAAAAFRRAIEAGCDHWRAQLYFARAAQAGGATAAAEAALAAARMVAPQSVSG